MRIWMRAVLAGGAAAAVVALMVGSAIAGGDRFDCYGCIDKGDIGTMAVGGSEIVDGSVRAVDLHFDPATQSELASHAGNMSKHPHAFGTIWSPNGDTGEYYITDGGGAVVLPDYDTDADQYVFVGIRGPATTVVTPRCVVDGVTTGTDGDGNLTVRFRDGSGAGVPCEYFSFITFDGLDLT